jgi:hypothetical protein
MRRLPVPSIRRTALLVTAGCLALGALPGSALAAPDEQVPAKPEKSQTAPTTAGLCPDGALCAWPQRVYAGDVTEIDDADAAGCQELARPAQSAINDSGRTAVFYASPGCVGGVVIGIEPGRKAPGFAKAVSVRLRTPGSLPGTTTPGTTPGTTAPEKTAPKKTAPDDSTADTDPATADEGSAEPAP